MSERATVAQSVEQLIRNQQVAGSSPASSSKNKRFCEPSQNLLFFILQSNPYNNKKSKHAGQNLAYLLFSYLL